MFKKLSLYWRTSKYLTFSQIYFRLLLIFRKKILYRFSGLTKNLYRCKSEKYVADIKQVSFGSKEYHLLLGRSDRISLDQPDNIFKFTFLNKTISFKNRVDWAPANTTFLWRYNLHYFDFAYDLGVLFLKTKDKKHYQLFKSLTTDWLKSNQIAQGIGWDPYPTSLRIINWIKAYHFFSDLIEKEKLFKNQLLFSIFEQTKFLYANIEYHLLNNHLIENGRALFIAGVFLNNQKWKNRGLKILWQELRRQVLNDGGQFELSPMYHSVVILIYIDIFEALKNLNEKIAEWAMTTLKRMVNFYENLCLPDGEIAYFNDSADGMTVPSSLLKRAYQLAGLVETSRTEKNIISFPDSGYYILQNAANQSKCIFDCGALGPDFQPGHGHCDILSYVWSYKGQRVIVDSGVDDYYCNDDWRGYYRSTRAHNTVEVNGVEQSEIWGNFRIGHRAFPKFNRIFESPEILSVHGSHNGYRYLKGNVFHSRSLALLKGKILIIHDLINGHSVHSIDNFLHLHPLFKISTIERDLILVEGKDFNLVILPFGNISSITKINGQSNPIQGWYAPEFGKTRKNDTLIISTTESLPTQIGYCIIPVEKEIHDNYPSLTCDLKDVSCLIKLKTKKNIYDLNCSPQKILLS